jgi:DNA-binding XRE family transcriptional regulator
MAKVMRIMRPLRLRVGPFRKALLAAQMTQAGVARHVGITGSAITHAMHRGTCMRYVIAREVAHVLGVTVEAIFSEQCKQNRAKGGNGATARRRNNQANARGNGELRGQRRGKAEAMSDL